MLHPPLATPISGKLNASHVTTEAQRLSILRNNPNKNNQFASWSIPYAQSQHHVTNFNMSNSSSMSSSLASLNSTLGTNQHISSMTVNQSYRDSRWLKLHVCPSILQKTSGIVPKVDNGVVESNNSKSKDTFFCSLLGNVCPYAHPPPNVRIDRVVYVTVCYDYIKRKQCNFSNCKYYHPYPHQIDAIIKRGDEQKKMLEHHQRLMELKKLPQNISNGVPALTPVVSGNCNSNFRWPSNTLLQPNLVGSVYLTPDAAGQAINPAAMFSTPLSSDTPNWLAVAAALQNQSQNSNILSTPVLHSNQLVPSPELFSTINPENWSSKRLHIASGDDEENDTTRNVLVKTEHSNDCDYIPNSYSDSKNVYTGYTIPNNNIKMESTPVAGNADPSGILNSLNVNLYNLPISSQQPSQMMYSPFYSSTSGLEIPTPVVSSPSTTSFTAFNNWLVPQTMHPPELFHPQYSLGEPPQTMGSNLLSAYNSNPALATAVALAAAQQQQQQALVLSFLLRTQQAQVAASQIAAMSNQVASGTPGYYSLNGSRLGAMSALSPTVNSIVNPSCSISDPLTSLSTSPYAMTYGSQNVLTNVAYLNEKGHLLETLPICRDFKAGKCHRNSDCRYVHVVDENVEVNQGRVVVCRDAAKGRCCRIPCKYYHIPLFALSANRSMALNSALANAIGSVNGPTKL